jgi:hypothetical protein
VKVDTKIVLDRSLAYPVRYPSEPEDLDWEVTQDFSGCVCLHSLCAKIMIVASLCWSSVLCSIDRGCESADDARSKIGGVWCV